MYRCLSCNIDLEDSDRQREHYKQEWHSYNLKRKLTKLPSVSYDTYKRIEEQYMAKIAANNQNDDKQSFYCQKCGKDFKNEKSFNQHLKSKKHFSNDNNLDKRMDSTSIESSSIQSHADIDNDMDNDSDWSDIDSNESDVDIDIEMDCKQCLFCEQLSDSLEDNVCHMNIQHSFFIPDIEYVINLEELINYLHEKISLYFECIWCCDTGKRFKSKVSAQRHMTDMGHTKMKHSGHYLLDYSNYYDYSPSYPDSNLNDDNPQQEVDIPQLIDDDWQLKLPSGTVIGHRSLFRYYKQNLKPINPNVSKSAAILGKIVTQYRSLGWTGTTGDAAIVKAKDIKFMNAIKSRYNLKLGQKHNKVLQTHFRSQIGF